VQALPAIRVSKPDCLIWFPGDACDQQLQQYRQAADQRQQQEFQNALSARYDKKFSEQQKIIIDLQTQTRVLQTRLDSQTSEALRSEARTQAFFDGLGGIIGIALAFLVAMASFRKLTRTPESPHLT
jgi:hypothetical protein